MQTRPAGAQPIKAKSRKAWKDAGVRIATANISGLGSLKDEMESRACLREADIILIQEHKFGPEDVDS